jgi:hypothetical protein
MFFRHFWLGLCEKSDQKTRFGTDFVSVYVKIGPKSVFLGHFLAGFM